MLCGRWKRGQAVWRTSWLAGMGWMLAQACVAAALHPDNTPLPIARTRAVRHFSVQGGTPAQCGEVGRWAEENVERVGRLLEVSLPPVPDRGLEIFLLPAKAGELPGADSRCVEEEHGRVVQQLLLRDMAHVDAEDALEHLVQLLLNERLGDHPAAMDRPPAAGPATPAWLAVGVAQNLYPSLRTRNGALVQERRGPATMPSLEQVLAWEYLSAGRSLEKAVCGIAVSWLLSRPQGVALVRQMLDRIAAGGKVTPAWLAERLQAGSVAAMEAEWARELRQQDRILRGGGEDMIVLLAKLRGQLAITSEDRQAAGDADALATLSPADLIAMRKLPWVRQVAVRKAGELRLSAIGRDKGFGAVVDRYCAFLDGLAQGSWGWILRRRLAGAEKAMNGLEQIAQARKEYLDRVERDWAMRATVDPGLQSVSEHLLERSALRDYVDRVERQYGDILTEPRPMGVAPVRTP